MRGHFDLTRGHVGQYNMPLEFISTRGQSKTGHPIDNHRLLQPEGDLFTIERVILLEYPSYGGSLPTAVCQR